MFEKIKSFLNNCVQAVKAVVNTVKAYWAVAVNGDSVTIGEERKHPEANLLFGSRFSLCLAAVYAALAVIYVFFSPLMAFKLLVMGGIWVLISGFEFLFAVKLAK